MRITLRNDFHNTTTTIETDGATPRRISDAKVRLCGIGECQCGSIRGPQDDVVCDWLDSLVGVLD